MCANLKISNKLYFELSDSVFEHLSIILTTEVMDSPGGPTLLNNASTGQLEITGRLQELMSGIFLCYLLDPLASSYETTVMPSFDFHK